MKERSRTEYSLINIFTGIAGDVVNTVIGFVCRVIFVRMLGSEYLGVKGLFTNILSVLSLAELGIGSAIIYALYKPLAEKDQEKITAIIRYYKKAYAVIGFAVAVMGLSVLPFLDKIIRTPPNIKESIYLIYLLYLSNSVASYFFSYRAALLTASQRQYIIQGYNYVVTILQSVFQIIFLLLTHEYLTYLIIQIIGSLSYNIWISSKAAKDYPFIKNKNAAMLSAEERRSLFVNIRALAINKLSGVLVNSTDNIAITYFTGLSSVGYASNYIMLQSTIDHVVTPFFNSFTASVGNLNATSTPEKKLFIFNVLNLMNFWLYGWGAIGMAFVSSDLVKLLFGSEYVLHYSIPLILAINMFSIGMLHAVYTYKSTMGLFRYGQFLLFFTGFINLFLDVIMGRKWGVFGIFLATLAARVCTSLWYEPYAVFKHGFNINPWYYWKRYAVYLLALLAAGALSFLLCSLCLFQTWLNVIVKVIICSVVSNLVFVMVFYKRQEFGYLLESGKNILARYIKTH